MKRSFQLHKSNVRGIFGWIFLISIFAIKPAQAQFASDYQFSANNGTYTPLPASATSVYLGAGSRVQMVPLGFSFNFLGTNYTTAYACNDGFLSFNPAAILEQYNNLSGNFIVAGYPSTSHPLVAPLWDQLDGGAAGSRASYLTSGLPGFQIFTFEWANWEWNGLANVPVISFQVKLYESTGKVEFTYQQEANPAQFGNASIGIAGSPTGPGNFLSLSNTGSSPAVSYTIETNTLNTRPATGQVYTFTPHPVSSLDARIVGLVAPVTSSCFSANEPVKFTLKNNGSSPLNFAATPITITGKVRGPNAVNFPPVVVNTGNLAPNATQDVSVSSAYNMGVAGTYAFNAHATMIGDGNTANDSLKVAVSRTVPPNVNLPQLLGFTGYNTTTLSNLYPGWYEVNGPNRLLPGSDWSSEIGLGAASNVTASVDFPGANGPEWMIGPKFIPATGTVLRFKTAITASNSTNIAPTNMAGTDDKVQVMLSADCGISFTPIYTFDASNTAGITNVLSDQEIPLATYAGQSIILAFYAHDGTVMNPGYYDFHVDDIFIGTPPPLDLAAVALVSPAQNGCFGNNENLIVAIKNYGTNSLDFGTTPTKVQINISGATASTHTTIINSGTLAPGASQSVTVGQPLNMLLPGTYAFIAFAKAPGDPDAGNDTIRTMRQTGGQFPLPQSSGFSGYVSTNSSTNISSIFPGWTEGTGVTMPNTRVYGWHSKTILGVPGNVCASIALTSNFKNEWLVSPKIVPTANTVLRFNAAITTANGNTPTSYAGMANTDNKVQVMVSTDCGNSFTPIYTFDASNTATLTNVLTPFSFPLGQYAGQPIIVALFGSDGTVNNPNDFDFNVDDIFIGTPPPVDLGVTALTSPFTTGCFTNAEAVKVTVQNFHASPIDFSQSNATVTVKVSGAATATLSAVVNSGTLAAGASQTVTLSPALNMLAAGTYNFKAYTTIAGDNVPANDTITATCVRYPVVTGSPALNFTGYTGTNLSAIFPDWREAYGQQPVVAPAPYWGAATGLRAPGNITAELYLHDTWQRDWLIGPTFTATASSRLMFEAAITDWGNLNPDQLGMANTDDSVQVLVSTDCGATYTVMHSFNATTVGSLTNVLTPFSFSLGAFAGQQLRIAFFGTGGVVSDAAAYGFHLDNIAVNSLTGTRETIAAARSLHIFPNPSNGTFEVKLEGNPQPTTLTIRTLTGQVLRTEKVNAGLKEPVKVKAAGLAPGVYLLEAQTVEGVQVARLIVQ